MQEAPLEKSAHYRDEAVRADNLRHNLALDIEPDEPYGGIVRLAALVCAAPMAAIAVVGAGVQRLKCPLGVTMADTSIDAGFVHHTLELASEHDASYSLVDVLPDVLNIVGAGANSWVNGPPYIRFYAGVPVGMPGQPPLGVLFAADTTPRSPAPGIAEGLSDLAHQLTAHVENRLRIRDIERALMQQRKEDEDLKSQIDQIHNYSRELQVHAVRLEAINARLEALAKLDGMTGLKNHRAFQERLEFEFQRAVRYSMPLSLLLLDVDHFKLFNDTYGHLAGDEVLKTVASVLQDNARGVDFVARYGGEEFVVILPHADQTAATVIGERLREAIENVVWPLRSITASFGLSTLTPSMTHASDLIALSDKALYGSKTAGRNRVTHANSMGCDAK